MAQTEISEDMHITCMAIRNLILEGVTEFTFTLDTNVTVKVKINVEEPDDQ